MGWTSAAFGGLVLAEWFIHLPLFNVFIGFPIQFLGLLVAAKYGYVFSLCNGYLSDIYNKVTKLFVSLNFLQPAYL